MAEDPKKTAEQPTATDEGAPKKGGNKMILIGAAAGATVIGIALALFVVKPMLSKESGDESADPQAKHAVESKSDDGHGAAEDHGKKEDAHGGDGGHGEGGATASSIYTIKDLVVNPAGTAGSRYLSLSIAFQLGSPEEAKLFEQNEPILRDALITILSAKSVAQLTDPREKEIARAQIRKRVEQIITGAELAGVFYTDFVLQ